MEQLQNFEKIKLSDDEKSAKSLESKTPANRATSMTFLTGAALIPLTTSEKQAWTRIFS